MDSKKIAAFLTGVTVTPALRYELGADPARVLREIGFDEGESEEIRGHLAPHPRPAQPDQAAAPWTAEKVWAAYSSWEPKR